MAQQATLGQIVKLISRIEDGTLDRDKVQAVLEGRFTVIPTNIIRLPIDPVPTKEKASGWSLVVISSQSGKVNNGLRISIPAQASVVIGRARGDLIIDDELISATRHAELEFRQGKLFIADCRSTNGTVLNGERISTGAVTLKEGDRIMMGHTILRLVKD